MTETPRTLPRIAMQSIAGGLCLMAFFTMMWAGIAQADLAGRDHHIVLIIFAVLSASFIFYGIRLFAMAQKLPRFTTDADKAKGKAMLKRFGIIFGIEFTAIPLACGLLLATGHQIYILPVIALIVGLHFYPMAKVFGRTIDHYLATWTVLCALGSICIMQGQHFAPYTFMAFLGIGVAMATSVYGLYMLREGSRLSRSV